MKVATKQGSTQREDLVNDMFSSALLLRSSGLFVRLIVHLKVFLRKHMFQCSAPRPLGAAEYSAELADFLVAVYKVNGERSVRAVDAYRKKVANFFQLFNGHPGERRLMHYYHSGATAAIWRTPWRCPCTRCC